MKLLASACVEVHSESSLLGGDSDRIDSETALPVLVSGCVVNRA